jgi:hypothetical protein
MSQLARNKRFQLKNNQFNATAEVVLYKAIKQLKLPNDSNSRTIDLSGNYLRHWESNL